VDQELIETYIKKTKREIELAKQRLEGYKKEIADGSTEDVDQTLKDINKNADLLGKLELRLLEEKKQLKNHFK